jgi:hypothetical protein
VLVFALPHTNVPSTARHTVSPAVDLVLGTLLLLVVFVVATGRDRRRREWSDRRREKAKTKAPPKWRRTLSKGSARDTFVIGILLSFPGASYIAGMSALHHEQLSTGATVLTEIAFNAIQMIVLELPLLGYLFAPEKTAERVDRFGTWLHQSGGRVLLWVCGFLGAALILRGLLSL